MTAFDIFTIRQWRECYMLEVQCSRPANAPRYKFTKTDFKRMQAANAKNLELLKMQFATLDEVMEEIKRLQFPQESGNRGNTVAFSLSDAEVEQLE